MWQDLHPLSAPRSSVCGLIQRIDSSLTLPMSYHKYNEWIMNGHTRLRLEFISYTHHCTLTFESFMVTISISVPQVYFLQKEDHVCLY